MNIESATYRDETIENKDGSTTTQRIMVDAKIDGVDMVVPMTTENRHYKAILEWVEAGNTIKEPE